MHKACPPGAYLGRKMKGSKKYHDDKVQILMDG